MLGIVGAVAGVALLAGGGWLVANMLGDRANDVIDDLPSDSQVPAVGECITEASLTATETEVVACDAPEAAWEVLGNAGTYTENDFDTTPAEELCADYPTTGYVLWIGEITGDGTGQGEVVCLEQVE